MLHIKLIITQIHTHTNTYWYNSKHQTELFCFSLHCWSDMYIGAKSFTDKTILLVFRILLCLPISNLLNILIRRPTHIYLYLSSEIPLYCATDLTNSIWKPSPGSCMAMKTAQWHRRDTKSGSSQAPITHLFSSMTGRISEFILIVSMSRNNTTSTKRRQPRNRRGAAIANLHVDHVETQTCLGVRVPCQLT